MRDKTNILPVDIMESTGRFKLKSTTKNSYIFFDNEYEEEVVISIRISLPELIQWLNKYFSYEAD